MQLIPVTSRWAVGIRHTQTHTHRGQDAHESELPYSVCVWACFYQPNVLTRIGISDSFDCMETLRWSPWGKVCLFFNLKKKAKNVPSEVLTSPLPPFISLFLCPSLTRPLPMLVLVPLLFFPPFAYSSLLSCTLPCSFLSLPLSLLFSCKNSSMFSELSGCKTYWYFMYRVWKQHPVTFNDKKKILSGRLPRERNEWQEYLASVTSSLHATVISHVLHMFWFRGHGG